MLQAFIIVLREGVEAFLIVAIILAYLRKTSQSHLVHTVFWGIGGSVLTSGVLGYFLWVTQGVHEPLLEGIFGLVTVVLVASLVIHMWKVGPKLKQEMEQRLSEVTIESSGKGSGVGVFLFTLFMVSREGMETALLLFQVHDPQILLGVFWGILGALLIAYLWQQFGYLIKLKHFFQVTAVFLLLFIVQVAVQSFHEFTETGLLPYSEALHVATEPFSSEGIWGKWFSSLSFFGCALWLIGAWLFEQIQNLSPHSHSNPR